MPENSARNLTTFLCVRFFVCGGGGGAAADIAVVGVLCVARAQKHNECEKALQKTKNMYMRNINE